MNKITKSLIIILFMIISLPMTHLSAQVSTWDGTWEPWTHGTGTEDDPFLIENAQQLAYLAYRVNNGLDAGGGHVSNHDYYYKLMIDVDLNGSETFQWTPIGYWNSNTDYQCFGGYFDGNDHTVSGVYVNSTSDRVGFFGYSNGTVNNLSVNGLKASTSGSRAGGIIGYSDGAVIKNCHSNYSEGVSSSSTAGGIMGHGSATIINCHNTGDVLLAASSGGIVGLAVEVTITNCNNTGNVSSTNSGYATAGGILGHGGTATIIDCYNTGNIEASYGSNSFAGGIDGRSAGRTNIINSYNVGTITSSDVSGGIIGFSTNGIVSNSYYLNTCGGNSTYGGQPLSSDAMKTQEFVETLNNGLCAWEYDSNNTNLGYPVLTMIYIAVTTSNATNVTQSYATLHGTIEVENTSIQSQGFEYKKTTETEYQTITVSGSGTISQTISNLIPNTQYQFRTFCTPTDCGTTYGEEKTFRTLPISVTTNNASDITQSHATLNGNLNIGDANISSQGFQYKKASDSDYQTIAVTGSGDISSTLSNLSPNTQYRFRIFCTPQGCETIYGQEHTLNTLSINVTTNNATDVTQSHATLNGNLNTGDANISSQGFQFKEASNSSYQTINVSGSGNVSTTLSDLKPNTQYRFRMFCNPRGDDPIYGQEMAFNTMTINVTTYPASNLTESSATLNGHIDVGDATLSSKGFEYRISGEPNYTTINVNGNGNDFTAQLSGLQTNNTYEYRAFMNIAEDATTYYGDTKTFTVSWLNQDTIFVNNAETLRWVADQCNSGATFQGKCIMLTNDITLPLNVPNNMVSIGSYPDHPFKGTFDGNGMLISNLYIDQPNTPYQGFFGYTLNANLYNVGLVNISASGRNYTGGMVAYAENTHLRDCYVNGGTLYALSYCGGLVGYQEQGTNSIISGCYNTCTVSGNHYVGGLLGYSNYGTVRNSYVAAPVTGQGTGVGGIIGGANEVLMYNCYFNTEITGQTEAIGENNFKGGEGMTSAQMRNTQFVATMNQGLVSPVWKADYSHNINNGFPILIWQYDNIGVDEINDISNHLMLYPNPANSFVMIQVEDENVCFKQISVYDLSGREICVENVSGQQHNLNVSTLPKGIYLVKVITGDDNAVNVKLLVQ